MILAGGAILQDESLQNPIETSLPIVLKTWLQWYLALEDNEFFVEVERDFIIDKFNLINLREQVGNPPPLSKERLKAALKLILSERVPSEEDLQNA
jgi:hypothetical protein